MKPILQTKFGKEGNCLCACLASILETTIERIPNPEHDYWQDEINDWLLDNYNMYLLTANIGKDPYLPIAFRNSYIIGCGKSINNLMHAVICKDGKIIHDPLPGSGVTYEKIEEFDLLVHFFN